MVNPIPGDAVFQNPGGVFSTGNPAFLITATTSGGAHTLHTAVTGTEDVDLVTLWAQNTTGTNDTITLEVGGVTVGAITVARNANPQLVLNRVPMSNGITLKAYAGTTSVIVAMISVTQLVGQAQ